MVQSNACENDPVTCISWYDAVEFCDWAKVRLPTEAEWEKAAGWDSQAEVKRIYPWGDELPDANRCNFDMQIGDTTPVDCYEDGASWYGVLDMAGNVWEWTHSLYKDYPYKTDDRENTQATGERVLRGGSFYQKVMNVRFMHRNFHRPTAKVSDYGFRVCAQRAGCHSLRPRASSHSFCTRTVNRGAPAFAQGSPVAAEPTCRPGGKPVADQRAHGSIRPGNRYPASVDQRRASSAQAHRRDRAQAWIGRHSIVVMKNLHGRLKNGQLPFQ